MAIILPGGFNITNNEPVDARITLADQTARYALSSANVYEGLIVFQQDSNTIWVLTDTSNVGNSNGWTQLQIGSVSSNLPDGVVSGSSQLTASYDIRYVTLDGDQTINGTKTFNDIVVNGTGSFAYIESVTGSAKIIGDAYIILNNNTPSERYAGIAVYDSGSVIPTTASLNFDGQTNDWFYEYSASTVDYGVILFGPEYNTKGAPTYLTTNTIPKAEGTHHLNDSNISDDGSIITLNSNSQINGNLVVDGSVSANNLISGSSQVIGILSSLNSYTASNDTTNTTQNSRLDQLSTESGSAITRLNTLEIQTSNLETFSSSTLTRLSTLEIDTANLETFTSSANTRLGLLETSTGSLNTFTSSINTTIKTRLNAEGVVSGSSQINVASTTGDIVLGSRTSGNYVQTIAGDTSNGLTVAGSGLESADVTLSLAQGIKTDSNPQFNSLGIGTTASTTAGEIRATGDITAFYSSDIRLKENITPISNALDKVNQISGNTYDWKEGFDEIHSHKGNDVGVIAQEIEEILPQIVTNRDNGFKAVQYEKIIPLLIEAIKELSAKIDMLENK